ncbi:MAG: SIS domain-containing protein [Armatimonadota bacterium]
MIQETMMSYMLDEIRQQPDVVLDLIEHERTSVAELAREIRRRDIKMVVMAARGTSDHAAVYGKYLLEVHNGYPVALADCSVFTLYSAKLRMENALVIGISQSGESADVTEYLQQSKRLGALTAVITNEPGSTLTKVAHYTILCHAGKEVAVAATKTYTSALAALYLMSASLADAASRVDELLKCAEIMREVLGVEPDIADRAERYRYMHDGYVISRGFNYCTAMEMALKLAETCYTGLNAYSAADFLHGPIAAVNEADPCFLIAPPGRAYANMLDIAHRLRERGAETVILSSEEEILSIATTSFRIGATPPEELSPLVYIIPGQLLAYHLSVARGHDPDRPRGLSKVTITR